MAFPNFMLTDTAPRGLEMILNTFFIVAFFSGIKVFTFANQKLPVNKRLAVTSGIAMKKQAKKKTMSGHTCEGHLSSVDDALYVIGGKWKLRVIVALKDKKSVRFNELQRTLGGISARVLSNELKELELNGFVKRHVLADRTPVVVEYEPTAYSQSLRYVIEALADWGTKHKSKIRAER